MKALEWTALVLACACAGEPTAHHSGTNQVCPPVWQAPCACPGSATGVQICRADGTGFEACRCSDAGGPRDGGAGRDGRGGGGFLGGGGTPGAGGTLDGAATSLDGGGGAFLCKGALRPQPEICDCLDNDCDGKIDQPPSGSAALPLCAPGSECVRNGSTCACAPACKAGEFKCSAGTECKSLSLSSDSTRIGQYCVGGGTLGDAGTSDGGGAPLTGCYTCGQVVDHGWSASGAGICPASMTPMNQLGDCVCQGCQLECWVDFGGGSGSCSPYDSRVSSACKACRSTRETGTCNAAMTTCRMLDHPACPAPDSGTAPAPVSCSDAPGAGGQAAGSTRCGAQFRQCSDGQDRFVECSFGPTSFDCSCYVGATCASSFRVAVAGSASMCSTTSTLASGCGITGP